MQKINYLSILKKSWTATWNNKYLWWFGFFIALSGTGSFFSYSEDKEDSAQWFSQKVSDFAIAHSGIFVSAVLALLAVLTFLLVMRILSQGALIEAIGKNDKGGKGSFWQGIRQSKRYFWRIFSISFLTQLAVAITAILIATPITFLFMTKSYILGSLLALAGILIFIPLLILVFFLKNYGFIYVVLGGLSIADAIENSYALFRKNVGASIVMALIFIPISIIIALGAIMLLFFPAIIFLIVGLIFFLAFSKAGAAIILALAVIFFILLFLGARSIYETFCQAAWIFFFREIAGPKAEEKVAETVPEIKSVPAPDPQNC